MHEVKKITNTFILMELAEGKVSWEFLPFWWRTWYIHLVANRPRLETLF